MQKGMTSIGKMVMQAALATVLIVTGLLVFAGGRGSEVSQAINCSESQPGLRRSSCTYSPSSTSRRASS